MQNPKTSILGEYSRLENLLKQKKWEEANKETNKLINQIINKNHNIEGFSPYQLKKILPTTEKPSDCELCKIDHLWVNHSDGRFGFSVQKEIYIESGGIENDIEREGLLDVCYRFLAEVGWREETLIQPTEKITDSQPVFRHNAKKGHLPYWYKWEPDGLRSDLFEQFKIPRQDNRNRREYELDENGECKLDKNIMIKGWGFLAFFFIVAQCGNHLEATTGIEQ